MEDSKIPEIERDLGIYTERRLMKIEGEYFKSIDDLIIKKGLDSSHVDSFIKEIKRLEEEKRKGTLYNNVEVIEIKGVYFGSLVEIVNSKCNIFDYSYKAVINAIKRLSVPIRYMFEIEEIKAEMVEFEGKEYKSYADLYLTGYRVDLSVSMGVFIGEMREVYIKGKNGRVREPESTRGLI